MDKEKNVTPVVTYQPKPKQKSVLMGFEFSLAVAGVVLGLYVTVQLLFYAFAIWTDASAPTPVFSQEPTAPVYGIAAQAFFGVILALFPVVFFPRFKRALADRPEFTSRLAYRLPLYVAFAMIFFASLYMAAHLIAIIVSSLLLIGVNSVSIGDLYLQQFLPLVAALGLTGFVGYLLFAIIKGKDVSKLLAWVVFGATAALTFAVLLSATINVHKETSSSSSSETLSPDMKRQLNSLYGE